MQGGLDAGSVGPVSSTYTVTSVNYPGSSENYQGSSGSYIEMYQLDFLVDLQLASGQPYYFFLDGLQPYQEGYITPYLHASNAALSGTPQEGSDDVFQWLYYNDGSVQDIEAWQSSGSGWDKNSDGNVQVFGTQVPDSGSMVLLLGASLIGVGSLRRRLVG